MARSTLSYVVKVDAVDDVLATHVNTLQENQEKIWNTLAFVEATELTIDAAGAVIATQNYHTIDTLADAASGNLDTITISGDIEEGSILIIRPDHTDRTIVIRHGIDNILCNGNVDITIDDSHDFAFLVYDEALTAWMAFSQWTVLDEDAMGSDSASALATQQSIKKYVDDNAGGAGIGQNSLINGGFQVSQRGTTFTAATVPLNSDDTFLLDRWLLLSDGNDIVDVSQLAVTSDENPFAMQALVATANKKFGFLQILESKDSPQIDQVVSLSFRAKTTAAAIRNVRAAVISWDGAEDVVTSDVVSAWEAEGTVPTLVANWTYENVAADNLLTAAYQTFTIENIAVDTAATKNVGVFIWVDDDDAAVNDILQIEWVKLELGATATGFVSRLFADELAISKRFFELIKPGVAGTVMLATGFVNVNTVLYAWLPYVEKRVTPTVTFSAVNAFVIYWAGDSTSATTDMGAVLLTKHSGQLAATTGAVLTAGQAASLLTDATGNAWVAISAEL